MAETVTFRPNEDDERRMGLISEHLTEAIEKPKPADIIRFALRAAERELEGQPKPRSPKPHKSDVRAMQDAIWK